MNHELLAVQGIFENVPEDKLARLYEAGETMVLGKGETLMLEGDRVEDLYCILAGEVDILVPDDLQEYEDLTWINILVEGDCIGEYSFVDKQLASATVRARMETTLFKLPNDTLRRLMDSDDILRGLIYENLLETLVQRLRNTNIYIDYLRREKRKNDP